MKWSEAQVIRAVSHQVLTRQCTVLVDNCSWTGHECDILAVTRDLRILDIEVKISRADFKADAQKDKWWHRRFPGWNTPENRTGKQARQWPSKAWKHYYAMPAEIWKPELLEQRASECSGIILLHAGKQITAEVAVKAQPNPRAHVMTPVEVMQIARLANLRMWEAYHRAKPVEIQSRPRVHLLDQVYSDL